MVVALAVSSKKPQVQFLASASFSLHVLSVASCHVFSLTVDDDDGVVRKSNCSIRLP